MERKSIKKLKAYNPGIIAADYKLDANENSYEIPSALMKKIGALVASADLNRYPDPLCTELRKALSAKLGVKPDNIVLGNGSDELFGYIIQAFVEPGEKILIPDPTFEMYGIIGTVNSAEIVRVALDSEFDIDSEKMEREISKKDVKVTFLSYPNNPTGNCFSEKKVLNLIKKASGLVVIDEAYYEFSGKTFIDKFEKYKNVIVTRTFSKAYSLAGLRTGYMAADKKITDSINKVRLPYNVNAVSQMVAKEILNNDADIQKSIFSIVRSREEMHLKMSKKFDIIKSDANFIFVRFADTEKAINLFRKNRISIRVFGKGRLKGYARITVGKPKENEAVMKVLEKLKNC